jgi:hypothetical protein
VGDTTDDFSDTIFNLRYQYNFEVFDSGERRLFDSLTRVKNMAKSRIRPGLLLRY